MRTELVYLKQIFLKNGSPEKISNKCFKSLINNLHVAKETNLTVEEKFFVLVLPYLGSASLKSRIKLKKLLKTSLIVVKLQIVFRYKTRLGNNVRFKDGIPKDLTFVVVHKFQCGFCNEFYYGECVRYIDISPPTKKQAKPKNSSIADHLLIFNHSASYDDFITLTRDNKRFLLESKESMLIMRDET